MFLESPEPLEVNHKHREFNFNSIKNNIMNDYLQGLFTVLPYFAIVVVVNEAIKSKLKKRIKELEKLNEEVLGRDAGSGRD